MFPGLFSPRVATQNHSEPLPFVSHLSVMDESWQECSVITRCALDFVNRVPGYSHSGINQEAMRKYALPGVPLLRRVGAPYRAS